MDPGIRPSFFSPDPRNLLKNGDFEGFLAGVRDSGRSSWMLLQNIIPLEDGSAIKLTVANYYTRGGHDIHLKGIEPDVEVELDADKYLEDETDTQLDKAVEVMKEEMSSAR